MNLSKIDALRSAASPLSGDATAKERHVNYDVFDVSVEACAAHTGKWLSRLGIGSRATMRKIVDFFVGAGGGASTIHTPPTSTRAQGVSGGVVGRGGESCWRG